MNQRSLVSIVRAEDDVLAAFDEAMRLCGAGDTVSRGDAVLVKPNLHGGKGTTSSPVMKAACQWAFERGADRVYLGDGSYYGLTDLEPYFADRGVNTVCEETGATIAFFDHGDHEFLPTDLPTIAPGVRVSRYALDCDVFINLPYMKTHFNTMVTLALKNLKGCLHRDDKRRFHDLELNRALAEPNQLVRPTVSVLDAIAATEGMGPNAGTPVALGLLLASTDPVALDAVGAELMGLDPQEVLLIRLCAEAGVGDMDLEGVEVKGESVATHRRRFERPYEALGRQFPGLAVHSEGACSGCCLNFYTALSDGGNAGDRIVWNSIAMGRSLGPFADETLCIGNCTSDHWDAFSYVHGCPPKVNVIREELHGELTT